jgi:predicted kinase
VSRVGVAQQTAAYRRRAEELAEAMLERMSLAPPATTGTGAGAPVGVALRETRAPRSDPALVALMGLPGAGKSHFARLLAQALGGVIIASDELRRSLFVAPSYARTETATVFRVAHAMARRLLLAGHVVIFDATNLAERDRRPLRRLAERAHARFMLAHLTAPEAQILTRLGERSARGDNASEADERVYRLMCERIEMPSGPLVVIDSTADVDAAVRRLADEVRRP